MDTNYLDELQISAASIPGREHLRSGRNNQDSFSFVRTQDALVGVVCDGCGSMPFSEVGAHLGARLLTRSLMDHLVQDARLPVEALLHAAEEDLLRRLRQLAADITPVTQPWKGTAARRLLFTIVGFVIREHETTLFACGDGVASLNGDASPLGPFPGNRPPYLAYRLLTEAVDHPGLEVLTTRPTSEIRSLIVGSDGLQDWLDLPESSGTPIPRDTLEHPAATRNPDFLRRRLTVAQKRGGPGALPDDTSLILVRREIR